MGGIDRFLRFRDSVIRTEGSMHSFAPDFPVNLWYLTGGGSNDLAFTYVREYGLQLIHVPTTESHSLSYLPDTDYLVVTIWEPYSAITIGKMKRAVDDGSVTRFGVILFQHSSEDV